MDDEIGTVDDGVVEAARAIRPYLDDLIGPRAAASLDRQLADQLASPAASAEQVRRLRKLLDAHADTRWFLTEALIDRPHFRPPYQQPHYLRRTGGPLGDPAPVDAPRYACPQGDYVWYRPDVGSAIPRCPTHHITLARS
jgi:hypothetical protein